MKKLASLVALLAAGAVSAQSAKSSPSMLIPKDEKGFAEVMHHMNQLEIRLGELAQRKGHSQAVKEYGQMMVADHTKADQELMAMAKTKGWKMGEPKAPNEVQKAEKAAHKANEAKLKALEGMAFDAAYMSLMVGDHDLAITKVAMATQQFAGSEMTPKLQAMLPVLQQHRQHAYTVLGQVKADPAAMGLGGTGGMGTMDLGKGGTGDMQHGGGNSPHQPGTPVHRGKGAMGATGPMGATGATPR